LKGETAKVTNEMIQEMQRLCDVAGAGVEISNFLLSDLNYAPEIAAQMLIRQQAEAYISAREAIAQASVEIVDDTMTQLKKYNMVTSDKTKDEIVRNLITVICSGTSATPTIPLNGQP